MLWGSGSNNLVFSLSTLRSAAFMIPEPTAESSAAPLTVAYRGLKLDYESQTYDVPRRELSGFPTGMSNTLHVMSGGMVTGTITTTSSGLTASSDFNPDVMLIYMSFLAPYASASSSPMRYYGNYRGPMPASYRIISLVLGLSALAFLGIGDGISTNFLNPLDSFAIFVVLAILSYAVRIIGRGKGRSAKSVQ